MFEKIYRRKEWGSDEESRFYSGAGSRGKTADVYISAMASAITGDLGELGREATIVDLGCGDFSVGARLLDRLPPVRYVGCDIVPELIEHHKTTYGNERRSFRTVDIASEELPAGDICLIRQVLQHLPNKDISLVIPRLRKYRYVYVTEAQPPEPEGPRNPDKPLGGTVRFDCETGRGRGLELDQPPFGLRVSEVCRVTQEDASLREIIVTWRVFL